jgi:hypothetical protein
MRFNLSPPKILCAFSSVTKISPPEDGLYSSDVLDPAIARKLIKRWGFAVG